MLPIPPSVNALYSTNWKTKRRFESERYERWKEEAWIALVSQPRHSIQGPISVSYLYGRSGRRRSDIFNLEKAVSDFLVQHRIIEDDSLIDCGLVAWTDDHPSQVEIIIRPAARTP